MKSNTLKGYKILVTAGSTWIPIDTVRVITNIFKGKIGFTIAEKATKLGADVVLLLGPSFDLTLYRIPKRLKIIRFKYFDDLDSCITRELKSVKYDAVIHSAAVSDFRLLKPYSGKVKSNIDKLILELVPTKKIVDGIKKLAPSTYLVKFKLEVGIKSKELVEIAIKSMKHSSADLIVANIYDKKFTDHTAYIINNSLKMKKIVGREAIAEEVLKQIHERI